MPVLNEAAEIEAALQALAPYRARGVEIIVADGGSSDGTAALARPLADRVIAAPRGRSLQMNAGAAVAQGDVLLFLHADSRLPEDADRLMLDGLARSGRSWGRFDVRFDDGGLLRIVSAMMNLRSRLTGIATGDQAMFVTGAAFERSGRLSADRADGGHSAVSAAQARKQAARLRARVTTSARRWRSARHAAHDFADVAAAARLFFRKRSQWVSQGLRLCGQRRLAPSPSPF